MPLKIATWNINSVRLRLPLVLEFLQEHQPDVLMLQEIKCTNDQFPAKDLAAAGYTHQAVNGQKAYHGVATISRQPLSNTQVRQLAGNEEARHVSTDVDYHGAPLTLHNFYIPAGGDVPDAEENPKFKHKLDVLDDLLGWFDEGSFDKAQLIAGDFNIAPHENDVWSHKQLLKVVSHTPLETGLLDKLRDQRAWVDVVRQHIPYDERIYSWWSYRAKDWSSSDKGRRLDHIWVTQDLTDATTSASVDRSYRGRGEKPSDHAPVIAELKIALF